MHLDDASKKGRVLLSRAPEKEAKSVGRYLAGKAGHFAMRNRIGSVAGPTGAAIPCRPAVRCTAGAPARNPEVIRKS